MTVCPRCAAPVAAGAWFCSRCGLDLGAARATDAAAGAPGPVPAHEPILAPVQRPPATPALPPGWPEPDPPRPPAPPWNVPGTVDIHRNPGWGASSPGPDRPAPLPLSMPAPPEAMGHPSGPQPTAQPGQTWVQPPAWAAVQAPRGSSAAWRQDALRAPGHTSGRVTVGALAVAAVASVVLIFLGLPLTDAQTWLDGFDHERIDAVSDAGALVSLVVAVAYLAWCYRVTAGFAWLTGRMPAVGKVASIGWWFVPLANLVMPAVILNGLHGGLTLPGRRRQGWLVPVWWIGFLLSRVLTTVWGSQLNVLAEDAEADAQAFASTTWLLLAGEALSVVAAVALIALIVTIGRDAAVRQRAAIGALPWPPPPDVR